MTESQDTHPVRLLHIFITLLTNIALMGRKFTPRQGGYCCPLKEAVSLSKKIPYTPTFSCIRESTLVS